MHTTAAHFFVVHLPFQSITIPASCPQEAVKAAQGVLSQVEPDGLVGGVSYGTPMGNDLDFYRSIPIQPTAYGQGLVFLMLTELMRGDSEQL